MSLYSVKKDILRRGGWAGTEIFYGDEETARKAFEEAKGITAFTRELYLFEIDTKGHGFANTKNIPFERYKPLDYDSYEMKE